MLLPVLAFGLITYCCSIAFYRLYLCSVASFPGPRLAVLTFWYEFWYDVVLKGKYTFKIQDLHRRHGPIVRINPEELHVADPAAYEKIYVGPTRRTNKWPWSAQMFGTSTAAVGTVDHDIHRQRRAALNPFFSKKSVSTQLEPVINARINTLIDKLTQYKGTDQPVNLSDAFACLSADVISDCAFGESYGLLEEPDFAPEWRSFMMQLSLGTHLMKQFGWAYRLIMAVAPWLLNLVHPLSKKLDGLRRRLTSQIEAAGSSTDSAGTQAHRTFFHSLLSGDLPEMEKTSARLTDEALTIIGAGTVTTAHTLALTMFHILNNSRIVLRLQKELDERFGSDKEGYNWTNLSQLPYLSAVITEGLRLSFGVSHRLQRISPDQDLQIGQWTIPAGTPVSMTQMYIMTDPDLFPQPYAFLPERWLANNNVQDPHEARKYFVPFSRGTRACVGMNLAYAELFLTIGRLLRSDALIGALQMKLFETTQKDFDVVYDWFNLSPSQDSKGLRVLIT